MPNLVMIDLPRKLTSLEKNVLCLYESFRGTEKSERYLDLCLDDINEIRENIMENEREEL
jgi:hypothetical protein